MKLSEWAENAKPGERIVYATAEVGRDLTNQIAPQQRAIYPGAKKDAMALSDARKVMLFQRKVPLLDGRLSGWEMIAVRQSEKTISQIEEITSRPL